MAQNHSHLQLNFEGFKFPDENSGIFWKKTKTLPFFVSINNRKGIHMFIKNTFKVISRIEKVNDSERIIEESIY